MQHSHLDVFHPPSKDKSVTSSLNLLRPQHAKISQQKQLNWELWTDLLLLKKQKEYYN